MDFVDVDVNCNTLKSTVMAGLQPVPTPDEKLRKLEAALKALAEAGAEEAAQKSLKDQIQKLKEEQDSLAEQAKAAQEKVASSAAFQAARAWP